MPDTLCMIVTWISSAEGDIFVGVARRFELVEEDAELGPVGEGVDVGKDGCGHCNSVGLQKNDVIILKTCVPLDISYVTPEVRVP